MFPHGGNQMSLAIAGRLRAWRRGILSDDAELEDGYLRLSDRPGIGFEGQARLYRIMRELAA
jgi:hypothetical protein